MAQCQSMLPVRAVLAKAVADRLYAAGRQILREQVVLPGDDGWLYSRGTLQLVDVNVVVRAHVEVALICRTPRLRDALFDRRLRCFVQRGADIVLGAYANMPFWHRADVEFAVQCNGVNMCVMTVHHSLAWRARVYDVMDPELTMWDVAEYLVNHTRLRCFEDDLATNWSVVSTPHDPLSEGAAYHTLAQYWKEHADLVEEAERRDARKRAVWVCRRPYCGKQCCKPHKKSTIECITSCRDCKA